MIEFKNVYKTYPNGFTALKNINLQIEQGEFVAIIGLSGAGKSTILRCINRMHDITKGELKVDGVDVDSLRGKELRYAHNQFFSVLHNSVLGVRDIIVRDENLRPNSKRAAKLRENTVMFDEMTPHLIMMGFPTVKWIDIAMFAIGLPSEVDQNASMYYIDAMEHLGLP